MRGINLLFTNYLVIEVESCEEKVWDYQGIDIGQDENKAVYELTGSLLFEYDSQFRNYRGVGHNLVDKKKLKKVKVIVDKDVSDKGIVIVQKVIHYGNNNVGTVLRTEPSKVEIDGIDGDIGNNTLFTGVVLGRRIIPAGEDNELYFTLTLVDIDGKGNFQESIVYEGMDIVEEGNILKTKEVNLGSVVRFSAKEDALEFYDKEEKYVFYDVLVINRYD